MLSRQMVQQNKKAGWACTHQHTSTPHQHTSTPAHQHTTTPPHHHTHAHPLQWDEAEPQLALRLAAVDGRPLVPQVAHPAVAAGAGSVGHMDWHMDWQAAGCFHQGSVWCLPSSDGCCRKVFRVVLISHTASSAATLTAQHSTAQHSTAQHQHQPLPLTSWCLSAQGWGPPPRRAPGWWAPSRQGTAPCAPQHSTACTA